MLVFLFPPGIVPFCHHIIALIDALRNTTMFYFFLFRYFPRSENSDAGSSSTVPPSLANVTFACGWHIIRDCRAVKLGGINFWGRWGGTFMFLCVCVSENNALRMDPHGGSRGGGGGRHAATL